MPMARSAQADLVFRAGDFNPPLAGCVAGVNNLGGLGHSERAPTNDICMGLPGA
jgi:hypothetical protein